MNKTITMIRIVAGLGENENIIKASNQLKDIDDLEITLVKTEDELIEAFKNPEIDAVIRGSLKASKVIKAIKEFKSDKTINRTTYINTEDDESFLKDYEFLLAPVGIDEGKNIEEKVTLAIQAANFIQYLGKKPKIAILAEGRKDDLGRSERIDESLISSEELTIVMNYQRIIPLKTIIFSWNKLLKMVITSFLQMMASLETSCSGHLCFLTNGRAMVL